MSSSAGENVLDLSRCGGPVIPRIGDLGEFDFVGDCTLPDVVNQAVDCPPGGDDLPPVPPIQIPGGTVENRGGSIILHPPGGGGGGGPSLRSGPPGVRIPGSINCIDGRLSVTYIYIGIYDNPQTQQHEMRSFTDPDMQALRTDGGDNTNGA